MITLIASITPFAAAEFFLFLFTSEGVAVAFPRCSSIWSAVAEPQLGLIDFTSTFENWLCCIRIRSH